MSQQNLSFSLLQGKELDFTPKYIRKNRLECCNSIFLLDIHFWYMDISHCIIFSFRNNFYNFWDNNIYYLYNS